MEKIQMSAKKEKSVTLAAALKYSGLTATGGETKAAVQAGLVKLNGEVCTQRGKKLSGRCVIEFEDRAAEIMIEEPL